MWSWFVVEELERGVSVRFGVEWVCAGEVGGAWSFSGWGDWGWKERCAAGDEWGFVVLIYITPQRRKRRGLSLNTFSKLFLYI